MSGTDERKHSGPPLDFAELQEMMLEEKKKLPKRIMQVAAYSLHHPDEIAFGTAASVAASAGVQASTLIRFARHFGFDGFTSLQSVFRERLRDRNASYDERLISLQASETAAEGIDVLKGLMDASVHSMTRLAGAISQDSFHAATDILSNAQCIYVVARRRSFPVGSYLAYTLAKLKIRSVLLDSPIGLASEIASFATDRDAVIAVSFSPYAQETIAHAGSLAERGIPVIGITDSAFSPLSELSKVWFEVVEADFGGFRSLAASMALVAALAIRVAEIRRSGEAQKGNKHS